LGFLGYCPAGGRAAHRDKFVGTMKIEEADSAEPRVDENVGRIGVDLIRARHPPGSSGAERPIEGD
jgi:hypothetical protein